MLVHFHGVRGSTPCAGSQYDRYGGNTSCVSVDIEGHAPIIFDLGTGLRPYGASLSDAGIPSEFHATVLLSHLHWDHIIGLPFFAPLMCSGSKVDVFGPRQAAGPLGQVFADIMRPPYFPIRPHELCGAVQFHDTTDDYFALGDAKVMSRWVRHTDPSLGFRVEWHNQSVAYVSDHGQGCTPGASDDFIPHDVLDLSDGVDVLIHDAQHSCEEFQARRHFGHSTVDYAVHVARESGAKKLVLFHHCPTHSDNDVDALALHAAQVSSRIGGPEVVAAYEGMTVEPGREHS